MSISDAEHGSESVMAQVGPNIIDHVSNSDISHPIIHLPTISGIDFSVTKHVLMLWIAAFVTILISLWATKSYNNSIKIPLLWRIPRIGKKFFIYETNFQKSRLSTIYEMLLEFIKQDIGLPNIGEKHT